jgi:hypothetical protein
MAPVISDRLTELGGASEAHELSHEAVQAAGAGASGSLIDQAGLASATRQPDACHACHAVPPSGCARWRVVGTRRCREGCAHLYRPDCSGGAGLQGDSER